MSASGVCPRCNRSLPPCPGGGCPACLAAPPAPAGAEPSTATPSGHLPATTPARSPCPTPDARQYLPEPPPGYELICQLGAGGAGTVYLAREHASERTVAMKLLHSPGSPVAFERFLTEARALARLDHPNIVKVIAVETNWREPYFTMEYAEGGTLADLVRSGSLLPPEDAARLVLGAAEAVAAAHTAGIIHRDIKPSNILLQRPRAGSSDGTPPSPQSGPLTPKVSDFGMAKRTDRDNGLTRTGPLGTPGYMAPEAAAGRYREVGPPADVYGLGATLYFLLTGRPPFTGGSAEEITRKVLAEAPARPRALRPDIPAELEGVVVKAMEKNPAARYPTAAALAADLRRFLAGAPTAAPVLSRARRARRWLSRRRAIIATALCAIALAALLVAAGAFFNKAPDPEQRIRNEIARGKEVRLLGADGRPRSATWPLGSETLETAQADGGTCSFTSPAARILLLLLDPGLERYVVRAEVRQKYKYGTVPGGHNNRMLDEVGLVWGYAERGGADGGRVHTMMVLRLSDYDPGDGPMATRTLDLVDLALLEVPGERDCGVFQAFGVAPAPLERLAGPDPPWRPLVVEVSPDGVRVPGPRPGELQFTPAASIARRRKGTDDPMRPSLLTMIAPRAGTAGVPDWSPRTPIGIWSYGSQVLVRNVTIQAAP